MNFLSTFDMQEHFFFINTIQYFFLKYYCRCPVQGSGGEWQSEQKMVTKSFVVRSCDIQFSSQTVLRRYYRILSSWEANCPTHRVRPNKVFFKFGRSQTFQTHVRLTKAELFEVRLKGTKLLC